MDHEASQHPEGLVLVYDNLLGKVRAEMISVPFGTGVICIGPNDATNWTNNCSNGQTMMLSRPPSPSLMVFRKPGWLGSWGDAGALNSSVWAAFGKSGPGLFGKATDPETSSFSDSAACRDGPVGRPRCPAEAFLLGAR